MVININAIFIYSNVPAPLTKVNAIANPCKNANTILKCAKNSIILNKNEIGVKINGKV